VEKQKQKQLGSQAGEASHCRYGAGRWRTLEVTTGDSGDEACGFLKTKASVFDKVLIRFLIILL
jgi:hypothetical protein